MEQQDNPKDRFAIKVLPWIVAAVAFIVYLVTLNRWVNLASLNTVAKVANWDWWSLLLQAPLYHLVTSPVRYLPVAWQPVGLNVFSAICAAGALGLLARSVALLPQDRTREQRQRQDNEHGFMPAGAAWVPPVFAAAVCGLQLSFWENATAASVEAFNILIFAYLVNCLLEYRIDGKESRLHRMAFVYGLAITTNWGMIALFPLFLVALIWIQKGRFLNVAHILRLAVCGLAGLLLYLYLPWLEKAGNGADLSFWQLMKTQLGFQKQMLATFPKYVALIFCLSSLLPVFWIGFRLPSSFGDTSVAGSILTHFLFRFIQAALMVYCLFIAFDPVVSPRKLGFGLVFLPVYYLGALSVGYFSGYFLMLCGLEPQTKFHRTTSGVRLANRLGFWIVCLVALGVPTALAVRNYLPIREANDSTVLAQYATHLMESLPAQGTTVVSDESYSLFLLEAVAAKQGVKNPHVLLDARSGLPHHRYLRGLTQRYPGRWPDVLAKAKVPDPIDSGRLLRMLVVISRTNDMYYLQPHNGYYAEGLSFEPRKLAYLIKPYNVNAIALPPLSPDQIRANMDFWSQVQAENASHKRDTNDVEDLEAPLTAERFVQQVYSRGADYLGVLLQRSGNLPEAGQCFAMAYEFNPDNRIAWVNQQFNANLRAGNKKPVEVTPEIEAKMKGPFTRWTDRIYGCGPFDEPRFCFETGESMAKVDSSRFDPPYVRQAAREFERVLELDPDKAEAGIYLASMYYNLGLPAKILEVVERFEHRAGQQPLSLPYQIDFWRFKAFAFAMSSNLPAAIQLLQEAKAKNPTVAKIPDIMMLLYVKSEDMTNALICATEAARLEPNSAYYINNQAAILLRMGNFKEAIPLLDKAVQLEPKNEAYQLNRAQACFNAGQFDEAEKACKAFLGLTTADKDPRVLMYLGEIAMQRKDNAKALENFQKLVEIIPRSSQGLALTPMHQALLDAANERLKTLVLEAK